MNFEQAVHQILAMEKGFVDNPEDPGGATNFGITQRSYPELNIASLTKDQAIDLYERDFWVKHQIERLPEVLRLVFFDGCVNQGAHFAVTALQHCVGSAADGVMGPGTFLKVATFHDLDLLEMFVIARFEHYTENKHFDTFGKGWIRRLFTMAFRSIR